MSQIGGPEYLYPPMSGGYGPGQTVAISYDPNLAQIEKAVKPAEPAFRPMVSGAAGQWPGFGPYPQILNDYYCWAIRKYPMTVKVHSRICEPIKSGTMSIEVVDANATEGAARPVSDKIKKLAEQIILPLARKALPGALEAPAFGRWLQELIWEKQDKMTNPTDVRSVLPWERILYVDEYRQFSGYMIQGQKRDARYGFLSVHNPHFDSVLGWACTEAALTSYFRACKSMENADALERKASGIQLLMKIMQGVNFKDQNGNTIKYEVLAREWMNAAVKGESGVIPAFAFSKDSIEAKPELANVPMVETDRWDWGNNGPMMDASLDRKRELDVEICSAWGVPERAVMEAEHGSRADAEVHSDVVLCIAENWHQVFCDQFNTQVTNRWVLANFPGVGIQVRVKPAPLADPQQMFLQQVMLAGMADATIAPEIVSAMDIRGTMGRVEMPLLSVKDAQAKLADMQQKQADQQKLQMQQKSQNAGGMNGEKPQGVAGKNGDAVDNGRRNRSQRRRKRRQAA